MLFLCVYYAIFVSKSVNNYSEPVIIMLSNQMNKKQHGMTIKGVYNTSYSCAIFN